MSRNSRWALVTLTITVALIVAGIGYFVMTFRSQWRAIEARQDKLLFGADHAALVEACRDVWQHSSDFGKDEGGYVNINPSNPKLPAPIKALNAHEMDVWPSGLNVELGGQGCHYGFEAFFAAQKSDEKRTVWKDAYPSKSVADGLWYYAENGIPQRPQ